MKRYALIALLALTHHAAGQLASETRRTNSVKTTIVLEGINAVQGTSHDVYWTYTGLPSGLSNATSVILGYTDKERSFFINATGEVFNAETATIRVRLTPAQINTNGAMDFAIEVSSATQTLARTVGEMFLLENVFSTAGTLPVAGTNVNWQNVSTYTGTLLSGPYLFTGAGQSTSVDGNGRVIVNVPNVGDLTEVQVSGGLLSVSSGTGPIPIVGLTTAAVQAAQSPEADTIQTVMDRAAVATNPATFGRADVTNTFTGSVEEGSATTASGANSHAEGESTIASDSAAHAEGRDSQANGIASHAEGNDTRANGNSSHAEGNDTVAGGTSAHAEGRDCTASGEGSHAAGSNSTASNDYSYVWSDGTGAQSSSTSNEYTVKATGGIRLLGGPITLSGSTASYSSADGTHDFTGDSITNVSTLTVTNINVNGDINMNGVVGDVIFSDDNGINFSDGASAFTFNSSGAGSTSIIVHAEMDMNGNPVSGVARHTFDNGWYIDTDATGIVMNIGGTNILFQVNQP